MSAINSNQLRQKQSESSEAVSEAIAQRTLSDIEDATDGADEDGSSHKGAHKAGKGKAKLGAGGMGAHGLSGEKAGHLAGDAIDSHVAGQQTGDAAAGKMNDPLGTQADSQSQGAIDESHLSAVRDLALPSSDKLTSAAGLAASAMSTDPTTAQAEQNLTQVLSSPTATTADINAATDKVISTMRNKGVSDADIGTAIKQITSGPSVWESNAASALVEAAKNGINMDSSNDDQAAALTVQKALDQKRNNAAAAQRANAQAAQQAAEQAAQNSANYNAGSTGGGGESYDSGSDSGGNSNGGSYGGSGNNAGGTTSGSNNSASTASTGGVGQAGGSAPNTPAKAPSQQQVMSMDQLQSKVPPKLAAIFPAIEAAAKQYNLQPQLLVAIAMEESTGGADQNAYSNGGGMFQFTDAGTWAQYGSGSRMDDTASAWACAKYMAANINDNGGDLSAALREYNGPIGQGGNPNYQSEIFQKMMGQNLGT